MADIKPPVLVEPIPDIKLNAGADIHIDLREHIHSPNEESGDIRFVVTLDDGEPLPEGMSCSSEGVLSGNVSDDAIRPEAYHLLLIAKNRADIPLITYSDLTILEAIAPVEEEQENTSNDAEDQNIFGEEEAMLPGDAFEELIDEDLNDAATDAMDEIRAFEPERLESGEFQERYIEYMLRRFSSLQIYNAEFEGDMDLGAPLVETSGTGWPIHHDGEFAMSTSNPHAYGETYVNRGAFVETVREMVGKAVEKGWTTLGVAGFDKHVGFQVIHQHNNAQKQKPANEQRIIKFDDIFQDKEWIDEMIDKMPPRPGGE